MRLAQTFQTLGLTVALVVFALPVTRAQSDAQVAFWKNPEGDPTKAAARLYRDLHQFKGDPEFASLGFGRGGPYYEWLQATEKVAGRLTQQDHLETIKAADCSLRELGGLGLAYMRSKGQPTDFTADVERRLGKYLSAIEPPAEQRPEDKQPQESAEDRIRRLEDQIKTLEKDRRRAITQKDQETAKRLAVDLKMTKEALREARSQSQKKPEAKD